MFEKKYIFETKKTKIKRRLINLFVFVFLCTFVYSSMAYYILISSDLENERMREAFFEKSPDLFVIFTGDHGRISFGIQKAVKYKVPKIFITGVYSANSVKTLLMQNKKNIGHQTTIEMNDIELDYLARNTVENVISTFIYLNKGQNHFKNVVIVSSDYHLFRIKMILKLLKFSDIDDINFYFLGNERSFDNWRRYKILFKEVYKSFKAMAFLLLWERETSDTFEIGHVGNEKLNSGDF